MQRRINYIEDLSPEDFTHLAQLLSYTPPPTPSSPLTPSRPEAPFPPSSFLASQSALLSSVSPHSSTPTSHSQKPPSKPFPPHLLRSTALLPRLALKLSPHLPFAAAQATLCSTHRPLNPYLIRRIFMQVCAETGLRVRGLVAGCELEESRGQVQVQQQQDLGKEEGNPGKINPAVKTWLRRLRTLNSLWMSPALYRVLTGAQPHEERFSRVHNECEACILAIVGGCATAICDLRAGMLGRKKSGRESRLWKLVEAWVDVVGARAEADGIGGGVVAKVEHDGGGERMTAEWIRGESERVGKLVMKERKRLRKLRRKERREKRYRGAKTGGGDGTSDAKNEGYVEKTDEIFEGWDGAADSHHDFYEPTEEDEELGDVMSTDRNQSRNNREAEDADLEGSIIDFYRRIVSPRCSLAQQNRQSGYCRHYNDDAVHVDNFSDGEDEENALHPAFRDSIMYSPTSGTFHRRPQSTSNTNNYNRNQGARSRLTCYTQSTYSQDDNNLAPLLRSRSHFGDDSSTRTPTVPPLPSPFVEKSSSSHTEQPHLRDERHIAEKRAQSYRNLVGTPNLFSLGIGAADKKAAHIPSSYHQTNTNTNTSSAPSTSSPGSDSGTGVEAPEPSPPMEAIREYMRHLWLARAEPDEEDDGVVGYMGVVVSGYDESTSSSSSSCPAANVSIDSSNSNPNPFINRPPPPPPPPGSLILDRRHRQC